jgi:hypothetical protein
MTPALRVDCGHNLLWEAPMTLLMRALLFGRGQLKLEKRFGSPPKRFDLERSRRCEMPPDSKPNTS